MGQSNQRGAVRYRITPASGTPFHITLTGRPAWMLDRLADAGAFGITGADHAGARVSAYVHVLKRQGVSIATDREPNGGGWTGTHARYRLACTAERVSA